MSKWLTCTLYSIPMLSALLFSSISMAAIDTFEFDNAQQEQTFNDLTKLLRCPKCQNQNISDSNAELAKDLRNKTYELVVQGKSEQEVVDYMVARFGNFVIYDPPLTPVTVFLWAGPLVFILLGLLIWFKQARRNRNNKNVLDEQEQQRLKMLLAQQDSQDNKS